MTASPPSVFFFHFFCKKTFVDKRHRSDAGRMPFLSPNQQCHNTEGDTKHWSQPVMWPHPFFIHHQLPDEREVLPLHHYQWCSISKLKQIVLVQMFTIIQCIKVHRVSEKTVQISFCYNFIKFPLIWVIFGRKMAKRLKLCKVHSISTSSNSHHHTTVINANVPNCYTTLKVVICNKLSSDLISTQ